MGIWNSTKKTMQWDPDFSNLQREQKFVGEIGEFESAWPTVRLTIVLIPTTGVPQIEGSRNLDFTGYF